MDERGQSSLSRLYLSMIVILFGVLGILFWGLGIAMNNSNLNTLGRFILGLISIVVLILERLIK